MYHLRSISECLICLIVRRVRVLCEIEVRSFLHSASLAKTPRGGLRGIVFAFSLSQTLNRQNQPS